jgi:hypothetical protein
MHDWVFERFVMAITSSPVAANYNSPMERKPVFPADQGEIMVVGSQIMLTACALISGVMYAFVWFCMAYAVNCY